MVRPEDEITSAWNCPDVVVSVICNTFNHREYISEAIEGVLMQETGFPFELIIHDDASSDGTAEVVADYAARYPRIIKAILQTENQYSKGVKPTLTSLRHVRGRYIAFCEGDDFWVDPLKLSTQVEILERHREIDMTFHAAYRQHCLNVRSRKIAFDALRNDGVVAADKIISEGGGFIHTGSIVIRAEVMNRLPGWFINRAPVGDYFIQIYASMEKGGYYLARPMSVYRTNLHGSWSARMRDLNARLDFEPRFIECIQLAHEDFRSADRSFASILIRRALILSILGRWAGKAKAVRFSRDVFDSCKEYATPLQRAAMTATGWGLSHVLIAVYKALRVMRAR